MRKALFAFVAVVIVIGAGFWYATRESGKPAPVEQVAVPLPPLKGSPAVLLPAPDPGLVENSPDGPLPIIGKDGREAWQVYARPFNRADERPRIALVITGLGLDRALSETAADRLPGGVTLGFNPYAADIKKAMDQARRLGHETLLGLPMEPLDYPRQDPGPLTLLAALGADTNTMRLKKLMGEASGYVGFVVLWGTRFTADKPALLPILEILKDRGLMYVDNKPPAGNLAAELAGQMKLPWAAADRVIDIDTDPSAIDQSLAELEIAAQRDGAALGIAALTQAVVDHTATWVPTLEKKGIALAPASAIADRQTIAQPATTP
jgi:uncharacterized protein